MYPTLFIKTYCLKVVILDSCDPHSFRLTIVHCDLIGIVLGLITTRQAAGFGESEGGGQNPSRIFHGTPVHRMPHHKRIL